MFPYSYLLHYPLFRTLLTVRSTLEPIVIDALDVIVPAWFSPCD
jgi:hypothetical protein